jgi:hypothetical protein
MAHRTRSDNARASLTVFIATTKEPVITLTTSFLIPTPGLGSLG